MTHASYAIGIQEPRIYEQLVPYVPYNGGAVLLNVAADNALRDAQAHLAKNRKGSTVRGFADAFDILAHARYQVAQTIAFRSDYL